MSEDKQTPGSSEPADIAVFRKRRGRKLLEQRAINTAEATVRDFPAMTEMIQRVSATEEVSLAAMTRPFAMFADFLLSGDKTGSAVYMMFSAYMFKSITEFTIGIQDDEAYISSPAPKRLLLAMLQHSTAGSFASFKSSLQVTIRFWPEETVPPQLSDMYQALIDYYRAYSTACESK